ncbi:hypothetical protein H310_04967 [Aphanomyces invadans]|uniref:Structural maintenance of chromosomes protein 5 n=1 Tax=Aphanomyces invadans TaxID=157072 RepID=A0A024UB90_9STRA|nr:hypothetical protein H310_04967 [Aphanomyces invadans]ETW03539.1 hypothetical protein H310_04967 [Aphanomyces invadans]|eukprot:XP_008867768.1 hypothetical protein H310_04967 [Aphanomyces invadans]
MMGEMAPSRNQEYVDGSIYRIRLHNFLTYADAELFPGPRLNLVIGPNGTGKSSIVCALCVGLGGSTKVLGRADKMGDFVQHEKESGFTEIELYFARKNVVIRRNIFRDNRSTWHIDNKESTLNKVKEVLSKAKIQIDNLCQFLPQDKVGDFSRMTPTQLLKATQAAIGNGELAGQQEEILKMEKENSTSSHDLVAARARLETMRSENLQRQRDVERIREQEARRIELANLKNKLMWVEYEEQRSRVDKLRRRKAKLKKRLEAAKNAQLEPLKLVLEQERGAVRKIRASKKDVADEKDRVINSLGTIKQQIERAELDETATQAEIQSLHENQRLMKQRLDRERLKEEQLREELSQLPDDAGLREEMVNLQQKFEAINTEIFDLTSSRDNVKREHDRLTSDLHRINDRLAKLDNEKLQRQRILASQDRDCMRAYDWVQQNTSRFQRKVWGPIALEIHVNDKLQAKFLEDTLQNYVLTSFVVECREDYDTMLSALNEGSQRLGVNVLQLDEGRIKAFQRPYSPSQFQTLQDELGITCYLDELIRAPEVIHQILRDHGGVHTMLVGTQLTEDLINRGVDVFSQLTAMNEKAALLTPSKKYVASVSKYGNKTTTTRSNDIRDSRFLAVSSDHQAHRERLLQEKQTKQIEIHACQEKINSVKAREQFLLESKHTANSRQVELREQLRSRQKLMEFISDRRKKIRALEADATKDVSDIEEAFNRKLINVMTKHVKQLLGSREMLMQLLKGVRPNEVVCNLNSTTTEQRVAITHRYLSENEAELQQLKDDYEQVKQTLVQDGKHAVLLKERAERAAPRAQNETNFDTLPDTAVELNAQIDNITAALAHFRGDLRVLDTYEQVQKEIEDEEVKLDRMESNFATLQDRINAIKNPWYAKLTEVVSKINISFAQYFKDIGCVGEIHLNEDGDISKWGIERRAQFRMTGKLTNMTAEEQSGGEKSVGTIMYLMALQNLTNCPFRVVDEINQGMDIHNERKVFSRITKSSCGSRLPQYFLITPKLITGLDYHPDTKVLIILNGPYNIDQTSWNTDDFVGKRQKFL